MNVCGQGIYYLFIDVIPVMKCFLKLVFFCLSVSVRTNSTTGHFHGWLPTLSAFFFLNFRFF